MFRRRRIFRPIVPVPVAVRCRRAQTGSSRIGARERADADMGSTPKPRQPSAASPRWSAGAMDRVPRSFSSRQAVLTYWPARWMRA